MNIRYSKQLGPVVAFACLIFANCFAQSMTKFVIQSKEKERFGFTRNGEFYSLGTKIDDFHRRFGAAEKSEKDEDEHGYLAHTVTDYYGSEGLMVTAKSDGTIIGFVFYLVPSAGLQPASVSTERGITTGASEREIIEAYGEPYRRKEYKDDASVEMYYKYGEAILSFRFARAVLRAISLNAEYLPYLPK